MSAPPASFSQHVPRETLERLEAYVSLLERWAPRVNLIARSTMGSVWTRHIADSLQLLPLLPAGTASADDVGSGAGFPGLVLAIASGVRFTLIESDQRKAAFLREAIRVTEATATVFNARFGTERPAAPIVTARAVAPVATILRMTPDAQRRSATYLLLKGASAESEIDAARAAWAFDLDTIPSMTDTSGIILILRNVRPI